VADATVLDTSAILTLTGNEPGADEVQTCLAAAIAGRIQLHGSFASLTEVEYITTQEEGAEAARQRLADLNALPIQ
jgi:PIN domain nuclease of toxin-antitoxin system